MEEVFDHLAHSKYAKRTLTCPSIKEMFSGKKAVDMVINLAVWILALLAFMNI